MTTSLAGIPRSGGQVLVGGWRSFTVMVNWHTSPLSDVHVTAVVPTGKKLPEGGVQSTMHIVGGSM